MISPLTIAYTVSSSYSGSTLLSMLLNAQPEIGTISEFDARGDILRNSDFLCSCGERIRQCPFFTALEKRVVDSGVDFTIERLNELLRVHPHPVVDRIVAGRLPYVRGPQAEILRDRIVNALPWYRSRLERFYVRNAAIMQAILDLQGASVFADANKDPHRMLLLARRFDVRPIYIFKNGIAGVYSMVKNAGKLGETGAVERATRRWFREQIGINHALQRLGGDHLQLSYSDLCADVDGTLRRITDFLGVGYARVADLAAAEHHIVGNRMRLRGVSEVREDTSWQERFSEQDVASYKRVLDEYAPRLESVSGYVMEHVWR